MKKIMILLAVALMSCTGCVGLPLMDNWDEPTSGKKEKESSMNQAPPIVMAEDINEKNATMKTQELIKELEYDESHPPGVSPQSKPSEPSK